MATTNAIIPTSTLNGIANAIIAKDSGGNMTAAQMATRIAAIQTGGWTKPSEWPDIRTILSAHTQSASYTTYGRIIFLFLPGSAPTNVYRAQKYWTSDDPTTEHSISEAVSFSDPTAFNWLIAACGSTGVTFGGDRIVAWSHAENAIINNTAKFVVTGSFKAESISASCFANLTSIQNFDIELSGTYPATSYYGLFSSAIFETAPEVDYSNATNVGYLFSDNCALKTLQDEFDFRCVNVSNGFNNTFRNCNLVQHYPAFLMPNPEFSWTLDLSSFTYADRLSFQDMIDGLNDVTSADYTRTITLPTSLRAQFTTAQATSIVSTATDKGYSLGNFTV